MASELTLKMHLFMFFLLKYYLSIPWQSAFDSAETVNFHLLHIPGMWVDPPSVSDLSSLPRRSSTRSVRQAPSLYKIIVAQAVKKRSVSNDVYISNLCLALLHVSSLIVGGTKH